MAKCKRDTQIIDWILYIECSECHNMKSEKEYFKWNCAYWLRSKCKECIMKKYADTSLEYRIINKEKINKQKREAAKRDREIISERRQKKKEQIKIYRKKYEKEHREETNERHRKSRQKDKRWAKRLKTFRLIQKLWIKPSKCGICNKECEVQAHHPSYDEWNKIIFVCPMCHNRIHAWRFECPQDKIIDLLSFNC